MNDNTTIIICCAGMGTRLGIGTTKALLNIEGKPLIIHQLEQLNDYDDIRIVVGYQAERVIDTVRSFRDDITFVFNYAYQSTGTAASFSKGLLGAREYVVAFDGDLLVNPYDLKSFLNSEEECIAGCSVTTDDPILMQIRENKVIDFSKRNGNLEWTGLAKVKSERLEPATEHIYMMLKTLLPINVMQVRAKEIDTQNDYEKAVQWVENGYND